MLEFLFAIFIGAMQVSFLLILFTFVPVFLIIRTILASKTALSWPWRLLYIFDFSSVTYFFVHQEKGYRFYNILLIIYGVLAVLALGFGLHVYF